MREDGFIINIAQRTPVRPEDCPPDSKLGRLHADLVEAASKLNELKPRRDKLRAALAVPVEANRSRPSRSTSLSLQF